jgi:hypothetical protein
MPSNDQSEEKDDERKSEYSEISAQIPMTNNNQFENRISLSKSKI